MQGVSQRRVAQRILKTLGRYPLGAGGLLVLLLFALVALLAPFLATHDPNETAAVGRLLAPSQSHWFGTDNFGRDVYSRVVWGARLSLLVGLLSTLASSLAGGLWGLTSGFFGGRVDTLSQRLVDILFIIPPLILALAIVTVMGASLWNLVLAIAIPQLPVSARVVRSAALGARAQQFVEAARAVGCSPLRLLFRHLAPNVAAPFIVIASSTLGVTIILEASLSFLGLGVPPPAPSWGRMLSVEGMRFFETAPWMALFPGITISLVVFSVNLLGDALRDLLDPRLRGEGGWL